MRSTGQGEEGNARAGFDFTRHMSRICADMVERLPPLAHVDMTRVAVSFCQTRKGVSHGMFASLTPLRFAGGEREVVRRGTRWRIQGVTDARGREMLYVLNFYLPRFLNLEFAEKISTTLHELWHIGPKFDGDLRRFRGRCYAHGSSKRRYEAEVEKLAAQWRAQGPPPTVYRFLEDDFRGLVRRHGTVFGTRVPIPKFVRLAGQ